MRRYRISLPGERLAVDVMQHDDKPSEVRLVNVDPTSGETTPVYILFDYELASAEWLLNAAKELNP